MEEKQTNSAREAEAFAMLILGLAALGVVALLIISMVYIVIFGLFGSAIYFGAKLGSGESLGKKTLYEKVKEIDATKREHLAELEGEDEKLRQLVDDNFEDEKMDLYRTDRPEPLVNIDLDAVKTTTKRVIRAVKGRRG